jgi:hypothetical protein
MRVGDKRGGVKTARSEHSHHERYGGRCVCRACPVAHARAEAPRCVAHGSRALHARA